jgi:hypothetical protein
MAAGFFSLWPSRSEPDRQLRDYPHNTNRAIFRLELAFLFKVKRNHGVDTFGELQRISLKRVGAIDAEFHLQSEKNDRRRRWPSPRNGCR